MLTDYQIMLMFLCIGLYAIIVCLLLIRKPLNLIGYSIIDFQTKQEANNNGNNI
jgi:hypothetical protein